MVCTIFRPTPRLTSHQSVRLVTIKIVITTFVIPAINDYLVEITYLFPNNSIYTTFHPRYGLIELSYIPYTLRILGLT